jgi:hypothetical protein
MNERRDVEDAENASEECGGMVDVDCAVACGEGLGVLQ